MEGQDILGQLLGYLLDNDTDLFDRAVEVIRDYTIECMQDKRDRQWAKKLVANPELAEDAIGTVGVFRSSERRAIVYAIRVLNVSAGHSLPLFDEDSVRRDALGDLLGMINVEMEKGPDYLTAVKTRLDLSDDPEITAMLL